MICIISGVPGTGKTLNAVSKFLIPSLKKGRKIHTNIELNLLNLSLFSDVDLIEVQNLVTFVPEFSTSYLSEVRRDTLYIIDEAQIYWGARDFKADENKNLLPILQKHRHYLTDFVFITQSIDSIDVGIRRLVEVHYRLVSLKNLGVKTRSKVKIFPDALGSENFSPMATQFWVIDRRIFSVYNSYAVEGAKEHDVPRKNIFLNNKKLIIMLLVLLFVLYRGYVFIQNPLPASFSSAAPSSAGAVSSSSAPTNFLKDYPRNFIESYSTNDSLFFLLSDSSVVRLTLPAGHPPNKRIFRK